MKPVYVADLAADQTITSFFLVREKEVRSTREGKPYLRLELGDRTGSVEARMWDRFEESASQVARDDYVKVQARVESYRSQMQLALDRLRRAEPGEVDPADYFPHTAEDIEKLYAQLCAHAASIKNPWLNRLVRGVVEDPDLVPVLKRAPAAKTIHHAFLGGLLEHVVSLCGLCRVVAERYPEIDADLLLTGAILHDIGKTRELEYARSFQYTTEGQLLGHITIAMRMVADKLASIPEFPPRLRTLVEHMILSHHGRLEFGSPKLPQFPEAMLLHYLDDLDSKMESMRQMVDRDRQVEGLFTGYSPSMERSILKKAKYLDESAPAPAAPAPSSTPPQAAAAEATRPASPFGAKLMQALIPIDPGKEG
jgi:3'-5' exoribonuclease